MLTWESQKALPSIEGRKMKYIILKSCVAAGQARKAGDIVDLPADEAAALKGYGRVGDAPEPKPVKAPTDRAAKPKTTRSKK